MSEKPQIRIVKKADRPLDPDLRRLVKAVQAMLNRRYTDPLERQLAAQKFAQEMKVAA